VAGRKRRDGQSGAGPKKIASVDSRHAADHTAV